MAGGGTLDVDVSALHGAGTGMSGKSGCATTDCDGLKHGVVEAADSVGNTVVKQALNLFHDDRILDPACKLPAMIETGGHLTANTAATTRDLDNESARATEVSVTSNLGLAARITPRAV